MPPEPPPADDVQPTPAVCARASSPTDAQPTLATTIEPLSAADAQLTRATGARMPPSCAPLVCPTDTRPMSSGRPLPVTNAQPAPDAKPTPVPEADRLCCECHRLKPLTEFRLDSRGGTKRSYCCRDCHNRRERERSKRQRIVGRSAALDQFSTKVNQATNYRRIEFLVSDTVRHFGGVRRFAQLWHLNIIGAMVTKPGSLRVLQSIRAIMRLAELVDAKKREPPDPMDELVANDDLVRTGHELFLDAVRANPMIAVECAAQLGWRVIPPDGSQG